MDNVTLPSSAVSKASGDRAAESVNYEEWMPWIEDQYLKWFGKGDNKASYVTKDTLSKSRITGNEQADQIQDDVANMVGNQISDKGVLKPAGNFACKEGINRYERNGKDEAGSYEGSFQKVTDSGVKGAG
ncbi:uncharacterized protein N7459_005303 [Penicillium hispanicum]|uniref:uncharacterized protein n=1 Tax=Penicillium hispanicum TaxID=1080232 RepID=UPI002541A5CD|nr:uncharacterized protein N7459_005303 [Penicillium hispanicum]KAJ5585503.1 hypothetical protein N7459_005303 [Penicillium hispanicum]